MFSHDFKQGMGCLALKKYLKFGKAACVSAQNLAVAGGNLSIALS